MIRDCGNRLCVQCKAEGFEWLRLALWAVGSHGRFGLIFSLEKSPLEDGHTGESREVRSLSLSRQVM